MHPLLDPRSPLGLPPRPLHPPKTEKPQALVGKGRFGPSIPRSAGGESRQVQRPNPRQVRVDCRLCPRLFLTTDDNDRRADFRRPARSLGRRFFLLLCLPPFYVRCFPNHRIALRCIVESFKDQRAKSVGSCVCSTGVQPSARPGSRRPTLDRSSPQNSHAVAIHHCSRALRHLFLFNPRPHPPRTPAPGLQDPS